MTCQQYFKEKIFIDNKVSKSQKLNYLVLECIKL